MILESKGAQLFFLFLGFALFATGIHGLANLDDVAFNFCLSKNCSDFHIFLNDVLSVLALAIIAILGALFVWLSVHSVPNAADSPSLVLQSTGNASEAPSSPTR